MTVTFKDIEVLAPCRGAMLAPTDLHHGHNENLGYQLREKLHFEFSQKHLAFFQHPNSTMRNHVSHDDLQQTISNGPVGFCATGGKDA
jgi:hypothetical protein